MDAEEKRIQGILGDDDERNLRNAERYRQFLLTKLAFPLLATGNEDFPWEEPYVFGLWDQDEYKKMKKTRPSYTDTFEIKTLEPPDEDEDVIADVLRISDGKRFKIGLSWLTTADDTDTAHTLLRDYGVWHTNY